MAPIIAKIVCVDDREGWVFFVWKRQILKAYFGCFKRAHVEQRILIELWRADGESADHELVEVAIGPTERSL